jgi:hypothetical protein
MYAYMWLSRSILFQLSARNFVVYCLGQVSVASLHFYTNFGYVVWRFRLLILFNNICFSFAAVSFGFIALNIWLFSVFCKERFCKMDRYLERKAESLTWRMGCNEKFNYLQFLKISSVIEVAQGPVGIDPLVASMLNSDNRVVR